jgi:hypothetical protein
MDLTVFITVLSGVLTYVAGQIVVKLVIEPVQDTRRTIGQISHALIERANVISNPGVPTEEIIWETAQHLRRLSSQLQSHLYLVPAYTTTAKVFRLPTKDNLLLASKCLIGLSNSVHRATERVYEQNAGRVEKICDALAIYIPDDERISKVPQ